MKLSQPQQDALVAWFRAGYVSRYVGNVRRSTYDALAARGLIERKSDDSQPHPDGAWKLSDTGRAFAELISNGRERDAAHQAKLDAYAASKTTDVDLEDFVSIPVDPKDDSTFKKLNAGDVQVCNRCFEITAECDCEQSEIQVAWNLTWWDRKTQREDIVLSDAAIDQIVNALRAGMRGGLVTQSVTR